jgi:predicted porin
MFKKTVLATTFLVSLPVLANAEIDFKSCDDSITLKIGANISAPYANISQSEPFKELIAAPGAPSNKNISVSDRIPVSSNMSLGLSRAEKKLEYGVYTKLNTNTSVYTSGGKMEHTDRTGIYLDHEEFGRLEVGSYDSVYKNAKITPSDLAVAAGGIDGDYNDFFAVGAFLAKGNVGNTDIDSRLDITNAFYNSVRLPATSSRRSNKVSYYAPNLGGISLGLSFVPDTEHQGTIFGLTSAEVNKKGLGYVNVIEPAIKYTIEHNDISYAISLMGNFGKAKEFDSGYKDDGTPVSNDESKHLVFKRHNLSAFEIGTSINIKQFGFAVSYANLGKSGGIEQVINEDNNNDVVDLYIGNKKPLTDYFSLAGSYKFNEKLSASATYYNSNAIGLLAKTTWGDRKNYVAPVDLSGDTNKFQAVSVGISYDIVKYVTTFAEYTNFKYSKNGALTDKEELNKISVNGGNVVLIGLKAKF